MSDLLDGKPTISFWIVGGAALVWNLIGFVFYLNQVTRSPEALATFTDAQQAFLGSTPVWATAAYAIAVNAGVLGGLFLLLRKRWAVQMFIASLAGIVVQDLHAFVLSNGLEVWGTEAVYLPSVVLVTAAALLMYSRQAKARGWLS
jgi:hypothetical protein